MYRGCKFFPESLREDTQYELSKTLSCDACPLSFADAEFQEYMRYYNFFVAHHLLPENGGLLDQQNLFLQYVSIVDATKHIIEQEDLEKAKKKNHG